MILMLTLCQNTSLQVTVTLPIFGVTKEKHVEDAVKAANITLTAEETALPEQTADALNINAIRFWEKEMK